MLFSLFLMQVRYRRTFNMGLDYIYLPTNLFINKQILVVYTERQILHDVSAR